MKKWLRILLQAGRNWVGDNVFKHSAAVSFYTLFSLSPVAIIAVSIAGAIFGEAAARGALSEEITSVVGEDAANIVETAVDESRPEKTGWVPTAVGIATLVLGATAVFAQMQDSLNSIWRVTAKPARSGFIVLVMRRLLSFALVITVGFLLLVSLVVTTALTATIHWAENIIQVPPFFVRLADIGISLTVITVLFAMIFKVLPDVQLRWRDVWKGALITALLFSGGRFLIAFYLGHSTVMSAYGAAGSLAAVLLWVYYSCLIVFFGAEFIRAYLDAVGRPPEPKPKAVRVRREIVTEDEGPEE